MEFQLLINWTSSFPFNGCWWYFFFSFNRTNCEQTEEILVIGCVQWHSAAYDLGLCHLHMSHNMGARLIWVKHMSLQALYNEDVQ